MPASITLEPVPSETTQAPPGTYTRGEQVQIEFTVKDIDGVPTEPADLTFTVRSPDGVDTEYVMGSDAEIVNNADGTGYLLLTLDQSARWLFRCVTDTPTGAAEVDAMVERSALEDPVIPVPGTPGAAYEGALARAASGVYSPYLATEEGETLTAREVGDVFFWVKERHYVRPAVDTTGVVDAQASIQAALNSRVGVCVQLPDGVLRMNSGVTVPEGSCLTGRERGIARGHRGTGGAPLTDTGTLIHVYGTGKLFTHEMQSAARNLELYYPDQVTTGTPTAFDYAFYAGANADGVTIENITAINPYDLIHIDTDGGGGATIDSIWAFPLSHGIRLGRVADVVRCSRVHFNPANNDDGSPTTWVAANGIAFLVDGAEQFSFTDCFAYGYKRGLLMVDADLDGFRGVYGDWKGGGFDQCEVCVLVAAPTGLCMRGLKMSDVSFIPIDTSGYGIVSQDTVAPSIPDNRPTIYIDNYQFSGTSHPKNIWLFPGSYTRVVLGQGSMQGASTVHCHAEGTGSIIDVCGEILTTGTVALFSGSGQVHQGGGWRRQVADELGPLYRHPAGTQPGANLTDADATITIAGGSYRVVPPATLTDDRVVDIDNGAEVDRQKITIDRLGTEPFMLTIRDNADATIHVFPASTKMRAVFVKAAGANFVCHDVDLLT